MHLFSMLIKILYKPVYFTSRSEIVESKRTPFTDISIESILFWIIFCLKNW